MEDEEVIEASEVGEQEVRWKQRFKNFNKAFGRLSDAIQILQKEPENVLMQAGLIQTYEFTFEVAWKTLKCYLEMEGFKIQSPRKAIRQAFQCGYIQEGKLWLKALNDRNLTTHSYDDEVAHEVVEDIQSTYYFLLKDLHQWLLARWK